jgi:hypothetical protein
MIAVRKIEPSDVQAGIDHFKERFRVVGSRSKRRNYF